MNNLVIKHHGAINGVTGSCHELTLDDNYGVLIDCGLFQGAETSGKGADSSQLKIDFPINHIKALVVTHVHIDHVGRIPYLLAAGFSGPILCSQPSAHLLPLVLEDAVKLGFTRDPELVTKFLGLLRKRMLGLPYKHWFSLLDEAGRRIRVRLQAAGHILGSAYVEFDVQAAAGVKDHRIVFSGDLGAPHAPLLPAPVSPYRCDTLVIESTYGNRNHPDRRIRKAKLQAVLERALADDGVVLIPAFSIGRTQEILYELEAIIAAQVGKGVKGSGAASGSGDRESTESRGANGGKTGSSSTNKSSKNKPAVDWTNLAIIVDSPLASRFTESYRHLKPFWDKEALATLQQGRDPLDFEQLITVDSHLDHERLLHKLKNYKRPCVVIAASGMCAGGRIVNYLKALLGEPSTDVLFVGYQAKGTPGREILDYSAKYPYVMLDGDRIEIRAGVHQISGYSAHADQTNLVNFVKRMRVKPTEIRLVHGDEDAKATLAAEFRKIVPKAKIWVPHG